jgi:hypothetical protein
VDVGQIDEGGRHRRVEGRGLAIGGHRRVIAPRVTRVERGTLGETGGGAGQPLRVIGARRGSEEGVHRSRGWRIGGRRGADRQRDHLGRRRVARRLEVERELRARRVGQLALAQRADHRTERHALGEFGAGLAEGRQVGKGVEPLVAGHPRRPDDTPSLEVAQAILAQSRVEVADRSRPVQGLLVARAAGRIAGGRVCRHLSPV